jgi:tetratricopeptide (TPR) repeat protein
MAGDQQNAHRTLAAYFHNQPQGPRQLDELPWQWQEAAAWQSLADLLAQPTFFGALWEKDQFEVKTYWTGIEAHSELRMEEVYARVIQQPAGDPDYAWRIGVLLNNTGKTEAALRVCALLVEHYREHGDHVRLQGALGGQANILYGRGDFDSAIALHKEAERLCRELGNKQGLQASLGGQALILYSRGDLDGAMALLKAQERLCRELGNPEGLSISLSNQAELLSGAPDRRGEARRLADEALAIATRHGYRQLLPEFQRIRDSISSSEQ